MDLPALLDLIAAVKARKETTTLLGNSLQEAWVRDHGLEEAEIEFTEELALEEHRKLKGLLLDYFSATPARKLVAAVYRTNQIIRANDQLGLVVLLKEGKAKTNDDTRLTYNQKAILGALGF